MFEIVLIASVIWIIIGLLQFYVVTRYYVKKEGVTVDIDDLPELFLSLFLFWPYGLALICFEKGSVWIVNFINR